MKYLLIPVLFFITLSANANSKYDPSKLNVCLKYLYSQILNNVDLIGETHTCSLSLKFASEKWLIFYDGYIGLDQGSKYSFLKFVQGMKLPKNVSTFKNVNVTFKVIATSESLAPGAGGWPGLEVQLLKISPNKSLNQIGAKDAPSG